MLLALLLLFHVDTARRPPPHDYVTPIERYVDSMALGPYDDGYYKMIERRHLREKGAPTFDIRPTFFDSPFVKPHDWC